jgi:hypothetical protein
VDVEPFTRGSAFCNLAQLTNECANEVVFGGSDAVTCSFGMAGRSTCIESVPIRMTTIVATYSGSVVPFYTLAASTPTKSYTLPDSAEFYALDHGTPERSCAEHRLLVLWCCISPIGLALQFPVGVAPLIH